MSKVKAGFAVLLIVAVIMTGCTAGAIALAQTIVNSAVVAINLAAALSGVPANQADIATVGTDGNALIADYSAWQNATADQKPQALAKVQADLAKFQADLGKILTPLSSVSPQVAAAVNFVIAEVGIWAGYIKPGGKIKISNIQSARSYRKEFNQFLNFKTGDPLKDKKIHDLRLK